MFFRLSTYWFLPDLLMLSRQIQDTLRSSTGRNEPDSFSGFCLGAWMINYLYSILILLLIACKSTDIVYIYYILLMLCAMEQLVVYDFMIPFAVAVLIQCTKLVIDFFTIKRLRWHHIFTA
jgi:hypothetical protein